MNRFKGLSRSLILLFPYLLFSFNPLAASAPCTPECGTGCAGSYDCLLVSESGTGEQWYYVVGENGSNSAEAACHCSIPGSISIENYPPGLNPINLSTTEDGFVQPFELSGTPDSDSGGIYSSMLTCSTYCGQICLPLIISVSGTTSPQAQGEVVYVPPSSFRSKNSLGKRGRRMYQNQIKIKASENGERPLLFRVYRDGALIKEIKNEGKRVKFAEWNEDLKLIYVYRIHAVDQNGIDSPPTIVRLKGTKDVRKKQWKKNWPKPPCR